MKSPLTKKYSLASRLSQRLNQSLQESMLSPTQIAIHFFSPPFSVFNFFCHRIGDTQLNDFYRLDKFDTGLRGTTRHGRKEGITQQR